LNCNALWKFSEFQMGFSDGPLKEAQAFRSLVRPEIISIFPDLNRALRASRSAICGFGFHRRNDAAKASENGRRAPCRQGFFGASAPTEGMSAGLFGRERVNGGTNSDAVRCHPNLIPAVNDRPILLFPACYKVGYMATSVSYNMRLVSL
jgi:hypothetical protein